MTREKIEAEKTFLARLLVGAGAAVLVFAIADNVFAVANPKSL